MASHPFTRMYDRPELDRIFAVPSYDEDEGLGDYLNAGGIWLNGFGFGSIAGALFTVAAALVWSFFL